MPAMFINDHSDLLDTLQLLFRDFPETVYAECHSVADAQDALRRHQPELVFLDHELTRNGHEGWEILSFIRRHWPDTRVVTTTYNPMAEEQYRLLGVEHVHLMDYEGIRRILRGDASSDHDRTALG